MVQEKIIDYASGMKIILTPEEKEATQPLSKELVEMFGYSKSDLITRPQYTITTPGEGTTYYPDVVIMENGKIKIVCECKRKNIQKGKEQLEKYMNLTEADFGIWFNGKERIYIKKIYKNNKIDSYKEIGSIPLKNRNSINNLKKIDLKGYDNLINIFKEMHSYISAHEVGKNTGIEIAENFIKILFCKIYDERFKKDEELLSFYFEDGDTKNKVSERIKKLFKEVKNKYNEVFKNDEKIEFSDNIICYIVNRLNNVSLMKSSRDAVSNAFEVFVGNALKGERGQFFTPRNVVRFILKIIAQYKKIDHTTKVIDPACGTGGFIVEALKNIWSEIEIDNTDIKSLEIMKNNVATKNIFGYDINSFVSKVTKAYMCIMGDGTSNIYKKNSLKEIEMHFNKMDLIITNPPFGKKVKIEDESILNKYKLSKMNNSGIQSKSSKTNPEILFIELCINLLNENGIMGIVLPEGIFVNPSYKYIREFILKNGDILSIISIPTETFKPHTGIKTSILIFRKTSNKKQREIKFFDVEKIGHDKNGKPLYKYDKYGDILQDDNNEFIIDDELNYLLKESWENNLYNKKNNLKTFIVPNNKIEKENIFLYPKYYSKYLNQFERFNYDEKKNNIFSIRDLIKLGIIKKTANDLLPTGKGIDSVMYSQDGQIPFIRTSDFKNLEIVRNPQKLISIEHYNKIKHKYDISPYDILFAKDGDHLVGETAMIMPGEERMTLQSHVYQFRVLKNEYYIDSFNLLKSLNNESTIEQIKNLVLIQGTIPSISTNIYNVKLVFQKDKKILQKESQEWKEMLEIKYEIKKKIKVKW